MRDVLDPANFWVGTPDGAQVFGNKDPVAVDDTLTVAGDGGPVSIDVLANDFDPEGGALVLISAFAGIGTAVAEANNTVTYTPPAGITGFDSVVYEIADDQDQRQTGQINITIAEIGFSLAVDHEINNTLSITADAGPLAVTVNQPAEFAGNYSFDTGDLASGPINLSPPEVTGTLSVGNVLEAKAGLWIYDSSTGVPTRTYQWRRQGANIPGATDINYTVQSADLVPGVSLVETATNALGARSASAILAGSGAFQPSDDALLRGWWDAADAATITTDGNDDVIAWADKSASMLLAQGSPVRRPTSGTRAQNGLNAIDCSGNSFLERTETFPASGNVAFHGVFAIDEIDNAFEAILSVDGVADFQLDANNASQFDGRLNATGIAAAFNLSGGPFAGAFVLSAIFDLTGSGTIEVFISNQSLGQTSYVAPIGSNAVLSLMTNRSQNAYVDGAVCEFIFSENVTNRADYHTYLATKWGVI